MWRILKDIPRAFRHQWNLTVFNPQTVSVNDDEENRPISCTSKGSQSESRVNILKYENDKKRNSKNILTTINGTFRNSDGPKLGEVSSKVIHLLEFLKQDSSISLVNSIKTLHVKSNVKNNTPNNDGKLADDSTHCSSTEDSLKFTVNLQNELDELNEEINIFTKSGNGATLMEQGMTEEAINAWRISSTRYNHDMSNFNLGLAYELGKGVKKSLFKAIIHYRKAAKQEHGLAMHNLGLLLLRENIGDKNHAIKLVEKAAGMGITSSEIFVGCIYMEEKRFAEAILLFRSAAVKKDPDAYYYLGVCYENALGVEKDVNLAKNYYVKACNDGHKEAENDLKLLLKQEKTPLLKTSLSSPALKSYFDNSANLEISKKFTIRHGNNCGMKSDFSRSVCNLNLDIIY